MCAITSLIINDYFGGDICKVYVDGISHYYNLIENHHIEQGALIDIIKYCADYKGFNVRHPYIITVARDW